MDDAYEVMGEFHDLFMTRAWERLRPALAESFGALSTTDVVVDIGAGTGLGTRTLAAVSPARVLSIEPSLTMRTALLARLVDDPDLARRVTVDAAPAPAAIEEIDGELSGFVCAHVLGHLSAESRTRTFAALARRMGDGAIGLVVVGGDDDDADDHDVAIGDHRFAERHDLDGGTTTYVVSRGDLVVREVTCPWSWQPPTIDELVDELRSAGLELEAGADGVGRVRAVVA